MLSHEKQRISTGRTLRALSLLGALALFLAMTTPASARRLPTRTEQSQIMRAFNGNGRHFPIRCVKVLVSTLDSRFAILTSPDVPISFCERHGFVGDGYVLFRRTTKRATIWTDWWESSTNPPCKMPRAVRVDLLGDPRC
jgi:hypothetical protein